MSKHYFAEDGNFGSAKNLVVVDTTEWKDRDWLAIENASDSERVARVKKIINKRLYIKLKHR